MMVLLGSLGVSCLAGFRWYDRLTNAGALPTLRWALGALPAALLSALWWLLGAGAAQEVREAFSYTLLFLALGGVWLSLTLKATAWLGIDVIDDALERSNPAAGVAVCGALVGSMTIYGFANLGEGATIWTTIGPALLGAGAAAALAATYQLASGAPDAITIERDLASGIRFAGISVGCGLLLGRPLAGDYVSALSTLGDFFGEAWPALPLLAWGVWVERRLRASRVDPRPDAVRKGLVPALGYVVLAALQLIHLGPLRVPGASP